MTESEVGENESQTEKEKLEAYEAALRRYLVPELSDPENAADIRAAMMG